MKSLCSMSLALAVLIFVAAPAAADVKGDLLALEKEMWTAWGKKDADTYRKYLDTEYREVVSNESPVVGKEATIKGLNKASCELKSVAFKDATLQDLGHDVFVLGYTATEDAVCKGRQLPKEVAVTSVWRKVEGKWMNAAYHESPILGERPRT